MPQTLPNLYCTPNDVYAMAGVDAMQLRLDDRNRATGYEVRVTQDAAALAMTLNIQPLQSPLLKGATLGFSDAGTTPNVDASLANVAPVGSTTLTVAPLAAAVNKNSLAIDNGVNTWLAGQLLQSCRFATARVKLYCLSRYQDSELVNSWSVNYWATVIACKWMAERCFQTAPQSIMDNYAETMLELKDVQASRTNIEGIGTRTAGWPFISNTTVDIRYTIRKVRVEQSISENTPTQFSQSVDWSSIFLLEW